MQILIVDDEEEIRDFVARALEGAGYECLSASNGREAIEKIKAGTFDVVLLDVLMPEADGVQVLNDLRKLPIGPDLRVIAMSGGGDTLPGWYGGSLMEMLGVESVLYKPFSVDELLSKISASTCAS
jgi:two-component system response regulator ResD